MERASGSPRLRARRSGTIVNFFSIGARISPEGRAATRLPYLLVVLVVLVLQTSTPVLIIAVARLRPARGARAAQGDAHDRDTGVRPGGRGAWRVDAVDRDLGR